MPRRKKLSAAQRKALLEGGGLPQVGQFLAKWMGLMGGPEGLAETVMVEFNHAKPGSLQRQRLLDRLLVLLAQVNDDAGESDYSGMETEDVLREFEQRLGEIPDESEPEPEKPGAPA